MTSEALCLHLLPCLFDGQGFAPDGRVTFACGSPPGAKKVTKAHRIRPRLRRAGCALLLAYFFLGKQEEVRPGGAQPEVRPALQSRL